MNRRDNRDEHDDSLPHIVGQGSQGSVRRGRRYTPPGMQVPRSHTKYRRHQNPLGVAPVKIGEVAAELTPRQAVVWLMNLDTMISLYESTTEQHLDGTAREHLVRALRTIVREHGLRK